MARDPWAIARDGTPTPDVRDRDSGEVIGFVYYDEIGVPHDWRAVAGRPGVSLAALGWFSTRREAARALYDHWKTRRGGSDAR